MGQQQLLLLIIGIIIVAFAVTIGITIFQEKMAQSDADVMIGRNLTIATEAVFWKSKRDPYSGGNAKYTGLETDGMQTLFLGEESENGTYKITKATDNELEITAVSNRYPDLGVRTYVSGTNIDSTRVSFDGEIVIE